MGTGPAPLNYPEVFLELNLMDPGVFLQMKLCLPNLTQHLDFPGWDQKKKKKKSWKTLGNSTSPSQFHFWDPHPRGPEPLAHPGKLRNLSGAEFLMEQFDSIFQSIKFPGSARRFRTDTFTPDLTFPSNPSREIGKIYHL